ncbi:MAG: glycosyltransferase [Nitrososphaera sp.]
MNPSISVLLPVYNAERYVALAVQSILDQSYRDFELILINDGSTDNSLSILETFAARDPRIRLISRENRGLVATLNEGLSLANGEFIARMDADDIALPLRFEKQLSFMQTHPECVAVGCNTYLIDLDGQPLRPKKIVYCTHDEIDQALLSGKTNVISHPAAMIRTDALHKVNGYRDLAIGEDYDLWLRLAEIGQLANLPDILLYHRYHTSSYSSQRLLLSRELIPLLISEAYKRRNLRAEQHSIYTEVQAVSTVPYPTKCANMALTGKNYAVALKHCLYSLSEMPFSIANWRLLAKCVVTLARDNVSTLTSHK